MSFDGEFRAKGQPHSELIVTLKLGVSAAPHSQARARIASRPVKMKGEESLQREVSVQKGMPDEKLSAVNPFACQGECSSASRTTIAEQV